MQYETHTVIKGDTLWTISQKYNVSIEQIKKLNNLDSNVVYINQVLKIREKESNHYYRVFVGGKQIGAYSVKENAFKEGWKRYNSGNLDIFLTFPDGSKYIFNAHQSENPISNGSKNSQTVKTPIMGEQVATLGQIIDFIKPKNPNFNEEIAKAFLEIGRKYGIRGDIAVCQSIIETGWFKFQGGTAVKPKQHNYCGLGVTSKGKTGASFNTIEEGVTAQIQHLYAYATKSELPQGEKLIDPRFKYVTRGIAPNWEDLSNRWAMNPNYGTKILELYNQLIKTPIRQETNQEPKENNELITIKKDVTFTEAEIDNQKFKSIIIDGKGYVLVSDVAELLKRRAIYDKIKNRILFLKK